MEIKASDVKDLREKTGAGMMDCKKALTEAGGDFAAAEKLLREWGMAGVEKRAGRATNEGRVFVKEKGNAIGLVEIACETDFVARNADFIAAGEKMAALVIDKGWTGPNAELEGMVKDIASVIKENISLKRVRLAKAGPAEFVHSYVHGEGKIGVIVKAKADKADAFTNPAVTGFVHDVALHIAAFSPMYLDQSKPEPAWVKEQEEIFAKQVELDEKLKTKPQNVIDGVLKGKLKKLMAEVCLLDQGFVKDEKQSVSAFMANVAKAAGVKLELLEYQYIRVGEA
ncbi:MAG TPA: translation elongation factor Ts [Rectinemataceae bacterium]|nr:translation elongation factor Ts [Rectinemataceae bacterium]